jgi:uroporphyrin-III C-methyltransferase
MTEPPAPPEPRVWLIGAGPGDPELMTLKAVRLLRAADVVLYDDLASAALAHARPSAELVAVGKRAGRPSPRQEHVSRLIVEHARAGRRVARLKSGDPGVFGRLDEEIAAIRAAGIAFEIVPGVSSANAAAAAARLSLTKRGVARRLQFVTGHDADGALPDSLDLAALADPDATTCVFMGKATFPALVARLVAHGLDPATPAILAENVGAGAEAVRRDTAAGLAAFLAESPTLGPCVIVYGRAIGSGEP